MKLLRLALLQQVFLICICISPLLLDLITYNGAVNNKVGIPAFFISLCVTLIVFSRRRFFTFHAATIFVLSAVTLAASILLGYTESLHFPNYIYSTLHFDYQVLNYISFVLLIIGFLYIPKVWLKTHHQLIIFSLGWLFIIYGFAFWFVPLGFFLELVKEGKAIESFQFLTLLVTAAISIFTSYLSRRNSKLIPWQKYLYTGFFLLFGLGCLTLAGEEVAWGQHWFGFSIEEVQKNNLQNEVTVHNNAFVAQFILQAYIAVTVYGSLSWLLPRYIGQKTRPFFMFFSEWYTLPYFLFLFLYQIQQKWFDMGAAVGQWAEYTELALYLGFFWIAYRNFQVIKAK